MNSTQSPHEKAAVECAVVTLAPDVAALLQEASRAFGRTPGELADAILADAIPQALEEVRDGVRDNAADAFRDITAERFAAGKRKGLIEVGPRIAMLEAALAAKPGKQSETANGAGRRRRRSGRSASIASA